MTTDERIAALKARITAATRARIRAEHARDAAEAAYTEARQQLTDEFHITDATQARRMLADLQNQLNTEIDRLTTTLDNLGV